MLSLGVGMGLLPCTDRLCCGQVYEVLPTSSYIFSSAYIPTSYAVGSYYPTAYYPSAYYSTAYYPTYYSSAYYYPTVYSSAYYSPTYYSSAYYSPTYYSTAYYPTYYSSAYYPTYYSTGYYPTYYSSSYIPTYYSSSYYPTYYGSSYYYPTTYYSTGYYLGSRRDANTDRPTTYVATTKGRNLGDTRRLVDRPVVAINANAHDSTTEQLTGDEMKSVVRPGQKYSLVRRAAYATNAESFGDQPLAPPVVKKTPPAPGPEKPVVSSAPKGQDRTNSDGGAPAKRTTPDPAQKPEMDEPTLEPAPPLDRTPGRRDSLRPRYPTQATRNVLLGRVESDTGESREGVRITVSSRTEPRLARAGVSNAFGRFAIRLDDGDWTVRVTMPSGRMYAVRQITVQDGRVIDNQEGRDVPDLIISY